ncbi:glycosyltransferase family 2 protein, partial [bacterium]|nr:glycosyltransferase family 2 protein [bacterium]
MNGNHNISAVIISFNEEKLIQQCIESILPITNDIIIVDSGSTDQTVSIATAAGARVFHMPWKGYGANKNFGNSKARHDWILSIDADEILDND